MLEGYKNVTASQLHVGDVVIVERYRWDFRTGSPLPSVFYRAVVDQHQTVSGPMFDLRNEPSAEFPEFAPWQGKIYAANDSTMQMWMKDEG